jgi:hypothetical protein
LRASGRFLLLPVFRSLQHLLHADVRQHKAGGLHDVGDGAQGQTSSPHLEHVEPDIVLVHVGGRRRPGSNGCSMIEMAPFVSSP